MLKSTSIPQISSGSTFYAWLATTNICANALSSCVLTSDAWGASNTLPSTGNVAHNGGLSVYAFAANTVAPAGGNLTFISCPVVLDSGSTLQVGGTTKLIGAVTANGTLTVNGAANLNSTLNVTGTSTLASGAFVANTSQTTVGNTSVSANLVVNGSAIATGDISGFTSSDKRLKDNINSITDHDMRAFIDGVPGVEFYWSTDTRSEFSAAKAGAHSYGVVAQDVLEVAPELVETRPDGYLAVNYQGIVPFLLAANRYLLQQVDELRVEVDLLKRDR